MARFVSVIVSTYNWPQALSATLESLRTQDTTEFEVIVADDGSGPATAEVVHSFQAVYPVALKHVWQPDQGPRLTAIRNRGIEAASGEYLVFTDGDCFFLSDFVSTHRRLAERGWFVAGKRSWLRPGITSRILADPRHLPKGGRAAWFARSLVNQCTRPLDFLPLPCDRHNRADDSRKAQGCNLGVWRDDCVAVNGFEEKYLGVGLEDTDFVVRLLRHGIKRKRGDHASLVLHLYHPRRDRPPESRSEELFAQLMASDRTNALVGLREAAGGTGKRMSA